MIIYLNDILIYTKNAGQAYVNAVWWVFKELRKHSFFANLKKCRFHEDEICFLRYIMSAQEVQIKEESIRAVKN